jgi:hypothetical protein
MREPGEGAQKPVVERLSAVPERLAAEMTQHRGHLVSRSPVSVRNLKTISKLPSLDGRGWGRVEMSFEILLGIHRLVLT